MYSGDLLDQLVGSTHGDDGVSPEIVVLLKEVLHIPGSIYLFLRHFQQGFQRSGIGGFAGQQTAGNAVGVKQTHQHLTVHGLRLFQPLEAIDVGGADLAQGFHVASIVTLPVFRDKHTMPAVN